MPTADRQPTAIDTDRDATEVELVVTDLDGTFLSPDGTVSSANAEAVRQWCDSGAQFMVATGRPLRWLDVVHDIAGVKPIVIASNGAVAYDMATGDEVLGRRIHPDVAGP
ncbi:MAG TPA: HAD hydrolase family protein, partial [Candidatus Avipropionibacterium avicola]|nr:HAD hydrolase family protein [Candidatus Avipropionibacterium avicola]